MGINILSITEGRKKLFQIAKDLKNPNTFYTLTIDGEARVVLMSAEEFDSWRETIETLYDFPDLKNDIVKARQDYKKGNYVTLEEVLDREGYILKDKAKLKYASSNLKQKSGKRHKKS